MCIFVDVIIGLGACTDSKVNRIRFKDNDFAAIADFNLDLAAVAAAKQKVAVRVGNLFPPIYSIRRIWKCSM